MAHKAFQLGLEMPALLGGIATCQYQVELLHHPDRILCNHLEMPALLGGIATAGSNGLKFRMKEKLLK